MARMASTTTPHLNNTRVKSTTVVHYHVLVRTKTTYPWFSNTANNNLRARHTDCCIAPTLFKGRFKSTHEWCKLLVTKINTCSLSYNLKLPWYHYFFDWTLNYCSFKNSNQTDHTLAVHWLTMEIWSTGSTCTFIFQLRLLLGICV